MATTTGIDTVPPQNAGGDEDVVASLAAAGELLRGRSPVHLKGFGSGMTPVYVQEALALVLPHDGVVWDGDPLNASGFTALIEEYLAAHPTGIAVAFKPRDAVATVLRSWRGVMERYPGRLKVVPVDIPVDTDTLGLHDEVVQNCAPLPGWAQQYYALGRVAIKVSGSRTVVSLGGGGIAAREAEAGVNEGASWTVFAVGRGKKESHYSLCDMAAAHPGVVTLVHGKDPGEALAFSGDWGRNETKGKGADVTMLELRRNSGKKLVVRVAVPTPPTFHSILDAAARPFKLEGKAKEVARLFDIASGEEITAESAEELAAATTTVAVSLGENFSLRDTEKD
eukprot:TRINITY_DN57117_c0_g1_i1.p1 TRINITY_DN57117_c0_g1~~TRINITY_DN57117_c0_g1_i1.p1  ORF type:complete len:360 (+),score=41.64 TRINITY_DN57117_c0_g1_i1:64-1080(+)